MIGLVVALSLILLNIVEVLHVVVRVQGAKFHKPFIGSHLSSVLLLINRAAASLFLLTVAYVVDSGFGSGWLSAFFSVGLVGTALAIVAGFYNYPAAVALFNLLQRLIYPNERPVESGSGGSPMYEVKPTIALVSFLNMAGLLVPSLLASEYADHRATLMQTGFIINTVTTLVNVIHVERYIALICERGSFEDQLRVIYELQLSRILGYVGAAAPMLLYWALS